MNLDLNAFREANQIQLLNPGSGRSFQDGLPLQGMP